MDTPTQALLGAVVGQAFFAEKLGRRALLWGARSRAWFRTSTSSTRNS